MDSRTDLEVALTVLDKLRARNALRTLDAALAASPLEGVTVYIGPDRARQRLLAGFEDRLTHRQGRTTDPTGDAPAGGSDA